MDISRRLVLKGVTSSGIAGFALSGSTRAFALAAAAPAGAARLSLLALANDEPAGWAFLQGATAASDPRMEARQIGCDLESMLDLGRRLRSGQAIRIIGLLDDATGTLVMDLARSAGTHVQWLGRHTAREGILRHDLPDTAVTEAWMRAVPGRGQPTAKWAADLGYRLVSRGTQTAAVPRIPPGNITADGSFVSFSIET